MVHISCLPKSLRSVFGRKINTPTYRRVWRGLRDQEMSERSGIPGCVFVHSSGFIGGNASYQGALEMALRTLKTAL